MAFHKLFKDLKLVKIDFVLVQFQIVSRRMKIPAGEKIGSEDRIIVQTSTEVKTLLGRETGIWIDGRECLHQFDLKWLYFMGQDVSNNIFINFTCAKCDKLNQPFGL